jgi:hypothetical protein
MIQKALMSDKNDYVNSRDNPATSTPTTLPSWLKDFNGQVGIGNWSPDEDYCNAEISSILLAGEAHAMSVLRNTSIPPRPPCDLLTPLLQ